VFNVGQGDHLILKLPNGTYGLIDFHYDKGINVAEEPPALTYLKEQHTPENPVVLSFLCISHPHRDHTKGLPKVLDWLSENEIIPKRIWLYPGINDNDARIALKNAIATLDKIRAENRASGIETSSDEDLPNRSQILRLKEDLEELWKFIKKWALTPTLIQGITRIDYIDGIEVCALAPLMTQIQEANQEVLERIILWRNLGALHFGDRNLVSSIIKLAFGQHQLLFGGDCGLNVWEQSLDEFETRHHNGNGPCRREYRASFIKASHHGSGGSSSVHLWERLLKDDFSAIGISAGEGQRHPSRNTVGHVNTAAQNRGASVRLCTTNLCHKCSVNRDVDREDMPSLRKRPKRRVKKATTRAVKRLAPDATSHPATDNESMNEALKEVGPALIKRRKSLPKQVGAYIFRLTSNSREIETTKVVVPSKERRDCLFGYVGKERFPKCAQ
jgi:beta-lactamase superfamily II metal-dependent hydrolase